MSVPHPVDYSQLLLDKWEPDQVEIRKEQQEGQEVLGDEDGRQQGSEQQRHHFHRQLKPIQTSREYLQL